jgi:hypothetical protein
MSDEKKLQIKEIMLKEWDNYTNKIDLAKMVEEGFIFGKYAQNEHYNIDELVAITTEIELEKNPPTPTEELNSEV